MTNKKDQAIKKILKEFEAFSELTLKQLSLLEKVLAYDGPDMPDDIIETIRKNEAKLDKFEVSISERIVKTIVLHKPVASDLRMIFACYRMSVNLERIGDLVMNIINFLDKVMDHATYKRSSDLIDNMLAQSSQMVTKALISFINNDKNYAIWTIKNDEVIDELYNKLIKKSITGSNVSDENKKMLLDLMDIRSIISNIERIADHATNIAEASIYSMEGTDVRHMDIEEIE
ncbi:MAG: phosphate uptake regulator PhoU [Bacteroidota bacterium]